MRGVRVLLAGALLAAGCSFSPGGGPAGAGGGTDGRASTRDGGGIDPVVDGAVTPAIDAGPPDAPPPPDATVCPDGFEPGPETIGGCYRYGATARQWQAAQDDCATTPGAHLVVISSAAENGHVLTMLRGATVYFGITDQATEGTYVWVNGEAVGYTNWLPGEGTSGSEDCGEMNAASGGWYDDQCDNDRPYVCER